MAEYRKYIQTPPQSLNSNNQGFTPRTVRMTNKSSRSKDPKQRLHCVKSKQTFLTDTQTSDYTKSSNQCGPTLSNQQLNETIKQLRKENYQLKQQIISSKSSAYFTINQDKLKDLITENQKLKKSSHILKKQLDDTIIQKNFLERFNKNLKTQCQQLTKEIVKLTNYSAPKIMQEKQPRNTHKNADYEDYPTSKVQRLSVKHCQQMYKSRKSYRSQEAQEKLSYRQRQTSKSKQRENQKIIKKSRSSSRVLQNQYFVSKSSKEETKKQKRTKKPVQE